MIINHNMSSINANNSLKFKSASLSKSMEKLASGQRINRAGDDASGLAVSEKMRGQIRGLNQAEKNIQNGVSFIQTTEGYLQETTDIVHRIRELAVQASNGIYTSEDRMQIQVEVSQLVDEVNRIASHAQFNGQNMLTGRFADPQKGAGSVSMFFHVGANMDQREQLYIGTMTAESLKLVDMGSKETISISTPEGANRAIGTLDDALRNINKQRADLGAYQNRFEMAQKGVSIASENLQAAESVIRDTDMAAEMVNFTRDNILSQAGTSMLAQANAKSSQVMQLLG
ncbi:MAG: flagellin [Spirochaetes bacterium GWF1_31_7]|nr:MAG: flagellin [Spirochaetes bacterium GWE1_32_154]OHD47974.1 MAG: flagellin [Spirochaetes bacterium GWF1_31_7]OHD48065.1 MAG: flagellin [Spirochaetes bacterium GWE2_31_10]OHD81204.1 MAG: flagellin [Spirochaetes bacterium RIFOXYB1_FULL_32_8]HBD94086.1 flagellin [Spirochaetia bacterium]